MSIFFLRRLLALLFTADVSSHFPSVEISNGIVNARVMLPDAEHGYYRGVRFDWAGNIPNVSCKGHEFFTDLGLVEEFRSADGALGYAATKRNGLFIKIGVGLLRKTYDGPYNAYASYALVNPGHRIVRTGKDRVEFEQELSDGEGYAFTYSKVVRLPGKQARLVLEHALKNTGRKTIETDVLNHDFRVSDAISETSDRPISSADDEIIIKIRVKPGHTFKWRTTYDFYVIGTKTKETGAGTS